jgi:hypothetical protein
LLLLPPVAKITAAEANTAITPPHTSSVPRHATARVQALDAFARSRFPLSKSAAFSWSAEVVRFATLAFAAGAEVGRAASSPRVPPDAENSSGAQESGQKGRGMRKCAIPLYTRFTKHPYLRRDCSLGN